MILTASLAHSQSYKETLGQENTVKLGRPPVSSAQAVKAAKRLMSELGVAVPGGKVVCVLKPRLVAKNAVASQWVVDFGTRYQVNISGLTGRALRFADIPALERISRIQAQTHRSAFGQAVNPAFMRPPDICRAEPFSKLALADTVIVALKPNGSYTERPQGLDVLNAKDVVAFQFSPETGRPILFSRSLDIKLIESKRRRTEAEAVRIAQESKSSGIRANRDRDLPQRPKVRLGYYVIPLPKANRIRYVDKPALAVLAYAVRSGDSEKWVDASTGRYLGGIKLKSE